jgi:RHS repeat-associated protein
MILNGRSTNIAYSNAKYKFTGKELDTETQYYHFTWRPYDGRIGRWMQTDPLAKKYPGWSPYNYGLNNPLKFFDFNGMQPESGDEVKPKENWWDRFTRLFSFSSKTQTPEPESGQLQSSTVNMLKGLNQTLESGQINTANKIQGAMNETYSAVYEKGPGYLNTISDWISAGGASLGAGLLISGQGEAGLGVLGASYTISTRLDMAATVLTGIDYFIKGGNERENRFGEQLQRTGLGLIYAKTMESLTSTVEHYYPIYSPIIF